MKKLFVILLTICIFLLPGCKPELPGVTIYIQNSEDLEVQPASYELEILFTENDRTPGARAFHMKNIGSDIVTNSRSIVLENMPKTFYIAKVKAYDSNGRLVGQGQTDMPFMASTTSSINVTVNEMPYANCSKKFNFPYGSIDSIKLNVKDTRGTIILEETYPGLSETTYAIATTGKIRIDSDASSFEWILKKGDNAVAVYIDTLDSNLMEDETRILDEVSFEMGFQEIADCTANTTSFDKLTLKVVPDEKLKDTISGFNFIMSNSTGNTGTTYRALSPDNLYQLPFAENETITHNITVIPVLKDGKTEINSLSKQIKGYPNIGLKSVSFNGLDTTSPIKLELGEIREFEIEKNPSHYTSWKKGYFEYDNSRLDIELEGDKVTLQAIDIADNTSINYKEAYHTFKGGQADFKITISTPELKIKTSGSNVYLSWNKVYDNGKTQLALLKTIDGKTTEIPQANASCSYEDQIPKETKVTYALKLTYDGKPIPPSNTVTYSTGKGHKIGFTVPEMKDIDILFEKDMEISEPLSFTDKVTFSVTNSNENIDHLYWMLNGNLVDDKAFTTGNEEFVFSAEDLNIYLNYGDGIAIQELTIAIRTTDGSVYSKNITLKLNMESLI